MKGRYWLFLALVGLGPVSLRAATVSFLIMETGLREDQETRDTAALWEYSLLDAFFDAGYIVSNAPSLRTQGPLPPARELPREVLDDFEEARQGGVDFFILALIDYGGTTEKTPGPKSVSLRLFSAGSRQFLAEEQYISGTGLPSREEREQAKNTARKLVYSLRKR